MLVRSLYSGVSRGTETLVFRGGVPESQYAAMRAPFQEGEFPGPVKYGYLNVGEVEEGPADLVGRTVFCLYPHQTRYVVPASAVTPVPETVPAERAVLAGTVETAVNALWDAAPLVGDRIAVVGGGMVGARWPRCWPGSPASASSWSTPTRPAPRSPRPSVSASRSRRTPSATATSSSTPAPPNRASPARWNCSARGHRPRTELVRRPAGRPPARRGLPLPAAGHPQQPGRHRVPGPRARRTYADRLALALELLADPALDALITGESAFEELPEVAGLASGGIPALCHRVRYDESAPGP